MNFDKLMPFILSVVFASVAVGKIEDLQKWIWKAQAYAIYESRSSNWGSPIVFKKPYSTEKIKYPSKSK